MVRGPTFAEDEALGFDLGKIETRKYADEGKYFPILHPVTGEPVLDDNKKPVEILISGADASRIKNAVEERQRTRRAAVEAAANKPADQRPDYNGWQTREKDMIDDLVLLTEGWTDNLELDGKPLLFSKENAAILYQRFPEIAEQMTRNATNRINFMPASPKK